MNAPLQVSLPNDRDLVVTRSFDAPRRLVFDAHTKPELVKRWMLGPPGWSMPTCEVDLRVGGKYRHVWAHPEHPSFEMTGVFQEIVAPERLKSTEVFEGNEAVWTMVLTETSGKTSMRYTMSFPSKEARDGALATGMTDGMEAGYARLEEMLPSMAS